MPSLSETIELARHLHEGVLDATGVSYIEHPFWVMNALPAYATDDDRQLAVLHDTLEDCKQRLSVLIAEEMHMEVALTDPAPFLKFYQHRGYSPYVVDGMRLLTRDFWFHLSYIGWIQEIAASGHRGAILVKYTDNCHHSDPERVERVLPDQRDRVLGLQRRYGRSKAILKPVIDGFA